MMVSFGVMGVLGLAAQAVAVAPFPRVNFEESPWQAVPLSRDVPFFTQFQQGSTARWQGRPPVAYTVQREEWVDERFFPQIHSLPPPLPHNSIPDACTILQCDAPSNNCLAAAPAPYGTIACHGCWHRDNECQTCSTESRTEDSECVQCRNSQYLLNGTCHPDCPEPYETVGTGTFNRECRMFECTDREDSCHSCVRDRSSCDFCRESKYLLNGVCVDSCPAGYDSEGSGLYRRQCVPLPAPGYCGAYEHNCLTCNAESTMCTRCRNSRYLHNGTCLQNCPNAYIEQGFGRFGRQCAMMSPGQTCLARTMGCHDCSSMTACGKCRDQQYLHNGTCIPACPPNTVPVGTGNYGRVCETIGLSCTPRAADCQDCNTQGTACTKCRNSRYLHNDVCIETCPAGTRARGIGTYNRECV
eukprot:m.375995 g.375995  ORF g.375995 m.375995 type:complete len:414 (+) comp28189_c0_seq2:112-1353(+)